MVEIHVKIPNANQLRSISQLPYCGLAPSKNLQIWAAQARYLFTTHRYYRFADRDEDTLEDRDALFLLESHPRAHRTERAIFPSL